MSGWGWAASQQQPERGRQVVPPRVASADGRLKMVALRMPPLLLLLSTDAAAAWQVCDVRQHGAKGDNRTKDTAAIKAAIEECRTGGEILLSAPGLYLTGALNLTSNQLLRVEPGAQLLASQDVSDFPVVASFPSYQGSRDIPNSTCRYGAVVGGVNVSNVSIAGGGVIDGQGWHFWALVDRNHQVPGTLQCSRPHLIEFEHSHGVAVAGLTLKNSPFWTSHFIYSRGIHVSELTILAPATRGNTDGINPDSSSDIVIENCYISNGDDGSECTAAACLPIASPMLRPCRSRCCAACDGTDCIHLPWPHSCNQEWAECRWHRRRHPLEEYIHPQRDDARQVSRCMGLLCMLLPS